MENRSWSISVSARCRVVQIRTPNMPYQDNFAMNIRTFFTSGYPLEPVGRQVDRRVDRRFENIFQEVRKPPKTKSERPPTA